MRSSRLTGPRSLWHWTVTSGFGMACFSMLGGCAAPGSRAPGGLGKFGTQPLPIPILHSIDPGVEDGEFATAMEPTPEDQKTTLGDYTVQINDLLQITISDLSGPGTGETVKVVRVNDSGDIHLPYINSLHAAGLTEIGLEQAIVEAYRKANLIQDPQVSISE